MARGRVTALVIAVSIIGLALMRTATASHDAEHMAFSGGAGFKGLVVKTDRDGISITSVAPDWQTVDSRGFSIPAGESQLIVVDFFAEGSCQGGVGLWCTTRALVGRTLATAEALEPDRGANFPFMLTGTTDSRATSRALCVRNPGASPVEINVWFQATKANVNITAFDLFGWTLKIARNAPCSPFVDI